MFEIMNLVGLQSYNTLMKIQASHGSDEFGFSLNKVKNNSDANWFDELILKTPKYEKVDVDNFFLIHGAQIDIARSTRRGAGNVLMTANRSIQLPHTKIISYIDNELLYDHILIAYVGSLVYDRPVVMNSRSVNIDPSMCRLVRISNV